MEGWGDIEKGKVDESVSVLVETRPKTVEMLRVDSPMPSTCHIFRVPEVLRRQNKDAYEPNIVSIGPFHRGRKEFELVEEVKKWYLTCVLERLDKSLESLFVSVIENLNIREIRGRYADTFHLDQNSFVEMLILDGCFLIELFRKAPYPERQDEDDPIFKVFCMLEYLYHDLLLLENQLPWPVLEFFYDLIEKGTPEQDLSVVVVDFFKRSVAYPSIFSYVYPRSDPIFHILDLIRTALVEGLEHDRVPSWSTEDHLPQRIPSATALSEARVTFKKAGAGAHGCILNIKFNKGVFTIPPLAIDSRTSPMFRNIMAFEQFYQGCRHLITSYVVLMECLLESIEDVDFLCKEGILVNKLSAEEASQFFKRLYNYDTTLILFHYTELCNDVYEYCSKQRKRLVTIAERKRWIEQLKHDYFDTPWKVLSLIAALILLVLTFLQTVYTIQQYYHPSSK